MKKTQQLFSGIIYLLTIVFSLPFLHEARAQHAHALQLPSFLSFETVKKECRFFGGDSLLGFPLDKEVNALYRAHGDYKELKLDLKSKEIAFIKKKYNLARLYCEQTITPVKITVPKTAAKYTNPASPLASGCGNLDFEDGNFNNWVGYEGHNVNSNNPLTAVTGPITPVATPNSAETSCNYFDLVNTGTDPWSGVNIASDPLGGWCARLGGEDRNIGANASCSDAPSGSASNTAGEVLQTTFNVTTANTAFQYAFLFIYADNGSHANGAQPYFRVEVLDQNGDTIHCLNYYQQGLNGAAPAGYSGSLASGVFYTSSWKINSLNLLPYLNQNVTVRFTVAGCNQTAHFGYAYVDCKCAPLEVIALNPFTCQGKTNTLTAPPQSDGSYAWTGPGIVGPTTNSVITVNQSGDYTVTITNQRGCQYTIDTNIVFYPTPTVSVNSATICTGGTATLSAVSTGSAGALTYTWNPSAGLTFSPGDSVATASPSGTTNYTVTGISVHGCTNTAIGKITVNATPPPTFSANPVCRGTPTSFTNTTAGTNTYHWDFGDITTLADTSNLKNPSYTYPASGNYVVSVTLSAGGGCTSTGTVMVTVNPNPALAFTANHPCDGNAAIFTNNTASQGSFSNWHWDFGDGSTSAVPAPTHTYNAGPGFSAAGCYSVTLTATTTAGCTGSHDTIVYIHNNPTVGFTAFEVCFGEASEFLDQSVLTNPACLNDQIVSYNWDFGDGQAASFTNTDTVKHTYAACGPYNITLTVTTNNNCTDVATLAGDTVFCLPVVTAPASLSVCPNTTVPTKTFVTTVSNGGPAFSEWFAFSTHTGMPAADSANGGYNTVPSYTSVPKNLGCTNLIDTVAAIAVSSVGCIGNIDFYTITEYPTPYVYQLPDDSVCANQPLSIASFTACPATSTIAWTNTNTAIGLAGSGTGNIPAFTATNSGTSIISGLVHVIPSANGCTGNDSAFSIFVKPLPKITVTSPAPYCPGDVVPSPNLTLTPAGNYNWTATNNANIGMPPTGSGLPATYTAPANTSLTTQTGVVSYTPSLNGCAGPVSTETITIKPTPVVTPVPSVSYCPNQLTSAINFSCTPSGGTPIFTWTGLGGIGMTQTGNIAPFVTVNSGSLTVVTTVSVNATLNNCKGPDATFSISVYPAPIAKFAFTHNICEGKPIIFTDQSAANGNFGIAGEEWDLDNDGNYNDGFGSTFQYTITPAGSHTVGLQVFTNSNPACTTQVKEAVYVNPNPVADFMGDSLTACPPLHTNFGDLSSVTSGQIKSWLWTFGNGQTSALPHPPRQEYDNFTSAPAYYSVNLTVISDSGCVNSKTKSNYIEVYPKPVADFSWGPTDANINDPGVTFYNNAQGAAPYFPYGTYGPYGVEYYLGDVFIKNPQANYVFNNTSFFHNYSTAEPYTYYATQWVINQYGCKDSITKPVEIQPDFTFYIPNAFSPTGDGKNDGFKGYGVGIDNDTYNLWVYDRWGLNIFHATDIDNAWDGRMHNNLDKPVLQQDVYVWLVRFKDFRGQKHEYKGTVTLLK